MEAQRELEALVQALKVDAQLMNEQQLAELAGNCCDLSPSYKAQISKPLNLQ